jgi:hypothetical protein
MTYQPPRQNQSNDFVILSALVSGIYVSVSLWEPVKPLVGRFLRAYQYTMGPEMTGFLDLISPLALYALVVAVLVGLLEGVLFPFVRYLFAEWILRRTRDKANASGKPPPPTGVMDWVWIVLGLLIVAGMFAGVDKPS